MRPGDRDLGGQARALGADRILDHLDRQHLAVEQGALDRGGGDAGPFMAARFPDVGHVQEGGAFQADVDEGRLHPRQHAHHLAEVDVPGQPARQGPFDVQFLNGPLQDERDARLLRGDVDEDVFVHWSAGPGLCEL